MLSELRIENFGAIEQLEVVFASGFTVLTGETGAGKTMLVEAIGLLIGGRADPAVVRAGAAEARVEGRFLIGDDEVVVARVVPVDGRSRAYVNGRLATVTTLAEVTAAAVEIHGQHEHQSLLAPAVQRAALDRFAGVDLEPLRAARGRLTEIDAALASLGGDTRARAREVDLLSFQSDEIGQAQLSDPDEEATLDASIDVLSQATHYRQVGALAADALSGDGGVLDRLAEAVHGLGRAAPFAELAQRLHSATAEVDDVVRAIRDLVDGMDDDPAQLETQLSRRQMLRDLRKKYGETLLDVIAFRDEVDARLAQLQSYEARVEALEADRQKALADERAAAAVVATGRRSGADDLASQVQQRLRTLAMPHAVVEIAVGGDDPADDVAILLAANPGSPPAPVHRVASGGELARTMLALRLVLTEAPDTLLFDEVDAGIGGDAAVAVADALGALGARHQVLVVTHLAQVAAAAAHHVHVSKRVADGATFVTATALAGDARVDEIARMLSGSLASQSAVAHARELLGVQSQRSVASTDSP